MWVVNGYQELSAYCYTNWLIPVYCYTNRKKPLLLFKRNCPNYRYIRVQSNPVYVELDNLAVTKVI